jgi:sec-independent protein translocase protein TatA
MPQIGPLEVVIVLVIALLVFGPKKLPELGKGLGRGMRDFKRGLSGDDDHDDDDERERERERRRREDAEAAAIAPAPAPVEPAPEPTPVATTPPPPPVAEPAPTAASDNGEIVDEAHDDVPAQR